MTAANFTPYGRVYLITNSANGKRYVGQTIHPIETRFRQHCALQAKCRALEAAIRKYGIECFAIIELATASTQDELNELEARYITELSTISPRGYNLRDGGGAKGAMHPETKEIMRRLANTPTRRAQLAEMRNRPDVQAKMTRARKDRWPDVAEKMRIAASDPEVQKRRIAATKAAWTRPDVIERQRVFLAEMRERPEVKKKRSASLIAGWDSMTPEQREQRGQNISASLIGHKKKIDYSPEAKAYRKEIAAKRWQDPAYREAMLEKLNDPEITKKRGEAIKAGWARRRERLTAEKAAAQ